MPANLTNIREKGVDLSDQYVSLNDLDNVDSFLNFAGQDLYYTPGALWTWGLNNDGQLGLGDRTNRSSPVQVGSLTNWKQVSSGHYYGAGIKTDGTLWAWGNNESGNLGLGDKVHRSSPIQVGSLTNWKTISCGKRHVLAIKTDGTLWVWGTCPDGLGLGAGITGISSPVQIGTLGDWRFISAGNDYSLGVRANGTLWGWGQNTYYQINPVGSGYQSPTQIGALTNWKKASAGAIGVHAIKTDGTLWAWGFNNYGKLGHGDTTTYSSPVQVGSGKNWKHVNGLHVFITMAIKTDNTLWTWGYNYSGQLGIGSNGVHRLAPVQVGSLANWKDVGPTIVGATAALKTNGTLWVWGSNYGGELGLGSSGGSLNSPVQVGALTTWKLISAGGYRNMMAIK